jgi:hypothetical protein
MRETLCGRLDRLNYARPINHTHTLHGKERRHVQHHTGLDTKKKRNRGGPEQYVVGTIKNAIHMIATKEDWKNDNNGRVA